MIPYLIQLRSLFVINKGFIIILVHFISACSNLEENPKVNKNNLITDKQHFLAPGKGNKFKDTSTNSPPEIFGEPITNIEAEQLYSFNVRATDAEDDRLRFSIRNMPIWLSFHKPTGTLTGTPLSTNIGVYKSITILVSDGVDSVSLPPFSITVNESSAAPSNLSPQISGSPDAFIDENNAYYFKPTISDEDPGSISISAQNLPTWLSINNVTGELSGTPSFNDAGLYSDIVLSVSDGLNTSDLGPFSIHVNNINQLPSISGVTFETNEDSSKTFLVNAIDPDADTIQLELTKAPYFGVIQFDSTNTLGITYTPNPDYHGMDVFELSVIDTYGASTMAEFTVNIASVNDVPAAQADNITATEDVPLIFDVLTNDRGLGDGEISKGTLTLGIESHPTQGNVEVNPDGSMIYTTNSNPESSDNFTYYVIDDDGEKTVASVSVTINTTCTINCTVTKVVSWDANIEPDIKGYYVYHGVNSGEYSQKIWVGNVTEYEIVIKNTGSHFFAVKAANTANILSDFSSEFVLRL